MKATVNGITVEGTADEIATIIRQFGITTPPNTVSSIYGGGLMNGTKN